MPAFQEVDSAPCDWINPPAATGPMPLPVISHRISTWPDEDFLTLSRRQKDAEIVIDYDV